MGSVFRTCHDMSLHAARKYSLRYKAEAAPACRRSYFFGLPDMSRHVPTCGDSESVVLFTGSVFRTCHDMSLHAATPNRWYCFTGSVAPICGDNATNIYGSRVGTCRDTSEKKHIRKKTCPNKMLFTGSVFRTCHDMSQHAARKYGVVGTKKKRESRRNSRFYQNRCLYYLLNTFTVRNTWPSQTTFTTYTPALPSVMRAFCPAAAVRALLATSAPAVLYTCTL